MLINTEHNMSMVEEWGDSIIGRRLFGMVVACCVVALLLDGEMPSIIFIL